MSELASRPQGAATPQRKSAPPTNAGTSGPIVPEPAPQPSPRSSPTDPALSGATAGAVFGDRYRLRTRVGSDTAAGAEFWRAEDTILRRDVALTVLRPLRREDGALGGADDPTGATRAGEMVVRALRSGNFEHDGCARLLDILSPDASDIPADVLGVAVTEWVPGRSLAEVVADGMTKPLAAARAVAPLAAAAEEAHRHGLVLGCDHPQRVRITSDGRARLSFALPRPDITPADDVRGLGAVLYTLLTSRWPLSGADAARAGLATADRTPAGTPVTPSTQRPGVPVELDTLAEGALGPVSAPGHVHTAAAMRALLTEVVEEDDRIALFPPAHDGVPSAPGDVWQDGGPTPRPADPRQRRRLAVGLIALVAAVVVVLGYTTVQLSILFSDGDGPAIVVEDGPVEGAGPPPENDPAVGAGDSTGGIVAVAGAEVYDKVGGRDNAGRISRVIDGDVESGWRTVTYEQQLPALKPGIGIMVSFASAVQLSSVVISSPSAGSVVQVRSAETADTDVDETTVITEVTLDDGVTSVPLTESQPVTHILLWITELGGGTGAFTTTINEIEFRRAGA